MKKLNKVIVIASKVFEVGSWIGVAAAIIMCFAIGFRNTGISEFFVENSGNVILSEMSSGGFTIYPVDNTNPDVCFGSLMTFFVSMIFTSTLTAMIFRNIFLIFRTVEGKTKFAEGVTPFQKPVIRMVREIGIFCVSIPVINLIISIIAKAVMGADAIETSVEMMVLIFGLVIIALSQFFAYGMELESDVEGLV
ncbi:MAG: hypothetical protein MJ162_06445 [Treponema sp.]|nr:hypothetical protein [Treponema sp.]